MVGREQAQAYARLSGRRLVLAPPAVTTFLFGGEEHASLGTLPMHVPLSEAYYLPLSIDVIQLNVPLLIGLDVLDHYGLYVNNVEDRLRSDGRDVDVPLVRKDGHIYLVWGAADHYTTTELTRVHRHFAHPHPDRLFAVLRQAKDPHATAETRAQLAEVTATCQVCQRLARAPSRFRVALPTQDIVFNQTVLLDLMYLDGKPVLHVVDKDTLFSAATLLQGETVEAVWWAYTRSWVYAYAGHPEAMHTDQGPQFVAAGWRALLQAAGTRHIESGVESHNSLGAGERYHAVLRHIYRRVKRDHPDAPPEVVLALSVSAMNQTIGPHGLVPTLLVFGLIPRIPVSPLRLPTQLDRMRAADTARKEMRAQVARARLRVALRDRVPAASDADLVLGAQVLVYREPPVDSWVGPHSIVARRDKLAWLDVGGAMRPFSVDKLRVYRHPPEAPRVPPAVGGTPTGLPQPANHERPPAVSGAETRGTGTADTRGNSARVAAPAAMEPGATASSTEAGQRAETGAQRHARVDGADRAPTQSTPAGAPPGGSAEPEDLARLLDAVISGEQYLVSVGVACRAMTREDPASQPDNQARDVYLTNDVPPGDPRIPTAAFQAAAKAEVDGLLIRGAMRPVARSSLPAGSNIIRGRFVFTLKGVGTPEEKPKARYVAQGHLDKAKPFMVHNLATLRQRSTRLLVSTSAVLRFRLFSHDINQAYLQSRDKLARTLYLDPRPEDRHLFDLTDDEVLLLVRPLYGVCDAGDYWFVTLQRHVRDDLLMTPLSSDPALYMRKGVDGLVGLMGTFVDDCLLGGTDGFQAATNKTLRVFDAKPRQMDEMEFVGVQVKTSQRLPRTLSLDQTAYVASLTLLSTDATYERFTSVRATLAWVGHTRPDLGCAINKAAQVSKVTYEPRHVHALNKAIKAAQASPALALHYPPLDRTTLQLRAYADASFATNDDHSSQLGFIILLVDGQGWAHVLSFSSRKSRRVVRSVMAGEVYAFGAAFDEAYMLRHDLERLYDCYIPLTILTDSKQLFDVVTRGSHPTEKRLLIDIAAAREAYNRREISNVGLVTSDNNMADSLTKVKPSGALGLLLATGVDRTPVEQWVIRPGPVSP